MHLRLEKSTIAAELRDVAVVYGNGPNSFFALKNICLKARHGEILLVMGPSGSGKSTLLQVLGCMRQPSTGSVIIDGMSAGGLRQAELTAIRSRMIGFVFQHYNLIPSLCAWENVGLALEVQGAETSYIEDKSRQILRRLGLGRREDAYPETLSGGEKQRVAIARAVVGKPKLILADEPTAALDRASGAEVADLLSDIAHEIGCAVVLVTHDQRIQGVADRIVYLEDGMIRSSREEKERLNEWSERRKMNENKQTSEGSTRFVSISPAARAG